MSASTENEIGAMVGRFVTKTLSKTRSSFAMILIPVVVLHLAWITPLIEWSCFCPDNEPSHRCCCNCPKCIKNRGGFKSFCHLRPDRIQEAQIAKGSSIVDLFSSQGSAVTSESSPEGRELSICQCDSHIKKISLDIKPFLPQEGTSGPLSFPVVRITLTDDWRPPEAVPCQPDTPG